MDEIAFVLFLLIGLFGVIFAIELVAVSYLDGARPRISLLTVFTVTTLLCLLMGSVATLCRP
jgi:hypothetical protein